MANLSATPGECTAGAYAEALASDPDALVRADLRELLAEADRRAVPSLTKSAEETRLESLVAVVRERTREEDLRAFSGIIDRGDFGLTDNDAERLAGILGRVAIAIRERQRSETGKSGGTMRWKNSDIHKLCPQVRRMYEDWQTGRGTTYKSFAGFAREVCKKFPVITSPRTVEDWMREWRLEAKTK